MAQALAEQIFGWHGGESAVWPPRSVLPGSTSYEVEGTVTRQYALNIRKANEQQGFLKSAVSGDVNFKHRALEVKISSVKEVSSGRTVAAADLPRLLSQFVSLATGSSTSSSPHLFPGAAGVAVFWADATLQSDLSSKFDGKPVELTNAHVRLQTEGSTLIARTVEVVAQAAENKLLPKLDDQPNLFAQAQGKFNPAAAAAIAKPQKKPADDEDWDD